MATFTITIPDEVAVELVRCATKKFGYQPGAETPEEFTQRQIIDLSLNIINQVQNEEAIQALKLDDVTSVGIEVNEV